MFSFEQVRRNPADFLRFPGRIRGDHTNHGTPQLERPPRVKVRSSLIDFRANCAPRPPRSGPAASLLGAQDRAYPQEHIVSSPVNKAS